MTRNLHTFLGGRSPFDGLPVAALDELLGDATVSELSRGERLWHPDVYGSSGVVVLRGVLREARPDAAGARSVTLGLHGRGALLGVDRILADQGTGTTEVEAWEDAAVVRLTRRSLLGAASTYPTFALSLGSLVSRRALWLEGRLGAWLHRPASARLAALLLELVERFGVRDSRGHVLPLRLPHRELASLIGVTRETATLALRFLRDQGWVEVDGKRLVVLNAEALDAHWRDEDSGRSLASA